MTQAWIQVCTSQLVNSECPAGQTSFVQVQIESLQPAYDSVYAGSVWSLAFTSVVGLYLLAKNIGMILAFIKGH